MENLNDNKILDVRNLRISFRTNGGTVKAVRGINFSLYKGRTLAIVGESGSGKSVTSKAILGILANNKIVENGQIIYDGQDLLKIDEEHFHKIRGVKISMIFQDPLSSLNPIMIVGKQLTEAMVLKHKADIKEAKKDLAKIASYLSKANPEAVKGLHEDNLSANRELFTQGAEIALKDRLAAIEAVIPELEKAQEADYSDDKALFALIKHLLSLKKELKGCALGIATEADNDVEVFPSVLKYIETSIKEAEKNLEKRSKAIKRGNAYNEAKLKAKIAKLEKEIASLSGESLKKKDTLTKKLEENKAKLAELNERVAARSALTDPKEIIAAEAEDFYFLPPAERAKLPEVILTRDEYVGELKEAIANLLAHLKALQSEGLSKCSEVAETAYISYRDNLKKAATVLTKKEADERAINMLKEVGIHDAERRFKQYPFELSGGMRQRIVIAIALCSSPEILICDEPTTALDVTIQSQILELINKLKKERNLSIVFITHDLGVVANMADDIAVMYAGKIVEYGTSTDIFYDPRHPYTIALLGSMPDLETKEKLHAIPGTPPNMLLPPKGDAFADRNEHALKIDYLEQPPFFKVSDTHYAATWVLDELAPDFEVSDVVKSRILRALTAHPEFTPKPTNTKNSVLNLLFAKSNKVAKAKKEEATPAKEEAPAKEETAKKAAPKKKTAKKEVK